MFCFPLSRSLYDLLIASFPIYAYTHSHHAYEVLLASYQPIFPLLLFIQAQREKGGAYGSSAGNSSSSGHGTGVGGGFINRTKGGGGGSSSSGPEDVLELLSDLREYDVTFSMRASIDLDLRCGTW